MDRDEKNIASFNIFSALEFWEMAYVDEKLLARLVDKLGLERQTTNLARSALWGKVTKEYNQVERNISKLN